MSATTEPDRDSGAGAADAAAAADARARARGRKTVGDLVRSLAVVLVLVGVIVALNVAEQPDPVVRDVDYAAALQGARTEASYDVLAPEPLPDGWRATSARTRADGPGVAWHLGLVTRAGEYAAVEQTDGSRRTFVDRFLPDAERGRAVSIGGHDWRRLTDSSSGDRGLLLTDADDARASTLLTGSASWAELAELARSL